MYELLFSVKGKRRQKTLLQCVVSSCSGAVYKQNEGTPSTSRQRKRCSTAFLNDDLQNRKYENVSLQAQRDVYQAQLQKCQDQIRNLIINLMFLMQMI